jgi:hypothetical protein
MKALKISTKYILILTIAILIFNIPVTTRQGIDGELFVRKIPLYAKTCGFLYRDYQYKALSRQITSDIENDTDKVRAIYDWTIANIRKVPEGFPGVDDHIWDIIVRRYGCSDQLADVFTTLTSYAGYEAFWKKLRLAGIGGGLVLSFVKIDNKWRIFDVYHKKSFMKKEELSLPTPCGPTYTEYLKTMDKSKFNSCIRRSDEQKIFPRIIYEFQKITKRILTLASAA